MAEDISNKTLAALLAITIVVSLGGTFFVLNNPVSLSGLAITQNNDTGQVNVTLEALVSLVLEANPNDGSFGDGRTVFMTNLTRSESRLSAVDGLTELQAAAIPNNYFLLLNNGTGSIDIAAYHDPEVNENNGGIDSPWDALTECTLQGAGPVDCGNITSQFVDQYAVYPVSSVGNCTTLTGQPIINESFALGTQVDTFEFAKACQSGDGQNRVEIGINMTTPASQQPFTNRRLNVTFLAEEAD